MSPDMFRGFGYSLVVAALLFIGLGAMLNHGCGYICKKYEVKIQEKGKL